ncbi:3-dehydroquinate synthase [Algivirga pacifica]|uniref:3-dehydroquinate synthase n=1 Tax=Algivirga pacifica TaxID=1162670 RepID=A0ABP9DI90_9BACT
MQTNRVSFKQKLDAAVFEELQRYTKVAVIVDENTVTHCYPKIKQWLPEHTVIQIQSGEENKTIETCTKIWQALTDARFDRKSFVLNLGGGVIGDMGGFCASTYKRGIDFWQMPTTLLSQVDASVGGKLGVDFGKLKNHIGIFRVPDHVVICPDFLETLPQNELRSGYAEVIKHGLIANKEEWQDLSSKSLLEQDWEGVIQRSVAIKKNVVENDPTEKGLRKILNFGHTIGHAIESYLLDISGRKLLHGEAIAIGMICEAYLSVKKAGLPESELDSIQDYILKVYGKVELTDADIPHLQDYMLQDKKNEGEKINCSLLEATGDCGFDYVVSWDEAKESIAYYMSL